MKIYLLSLIFILSVVACNPESAQKTANEKLIDQYFAYFNAHDFKSMAAMYHENAEFKDPSFGTGIVKQSKADTEKKYAELASMFPNLKDTVLKMYPADEEHIIVEFVSSGTAIDKTTFEVPICTIFTIKNGKITQDFTYYDNN